MITLRQPMGPFKQDYRLGIVEVGCVDVTASYATWTVK